MYLQSYNKLTLSAKLSENIVLQLKFVDFHVYQYG